MKHVNLKLNYGTVRFDLLTFVLLVSLTSGCRATNVPTTEPNHESNGESGQDSTSRPPIVQPQKQVNVISQSLTAAADANGSMVGTIHLRLDYISPPKTNGVAVASCYDQYAPTMTIGNVTCIEQPTIKAELKVSQTNQICFTQSTTPKVIAVSGVRLPGCTAKLLIEIFKFSPEIKIEIIN
ncbi:MAG: hypothetical protein NT027_13905 [Proteobacteria bacterium]|nr:hypothetical protein [Pseudomonadota bacterium]